MMVVSTANRLNKDHETTLADGGSKNNQIARGNLSGFGE
jgi:hypothetical protein